MASAVVENRPLVLLEWEGRGGGDGHWTINDD